MIELRMARLAPISAGNPDPMSAGETTGLAFSYLTIFRRVVVSLAVVGAVVAFVEQWPSLFAAFVCIGIGELLESSYYLSVLQWRQGMRVGEGYTCVASVGARGSSQATTSITSEVASTPKKTA